MKTQNLNWLLAMIFMAGCQTQADARNQKPAQTVPELHIISEATLKVPYSCDGSYEKSALFLSEYSKRRNSPELLYNGACGSQMYFDVNTAGDDMALIADLGAVPLERISAHVALDDGQRLKFTTSAAVVVGHSYAVVISKSEFRGLFVFQVENFVADGELRLRYAVKSYAIQEATSSSGGFNWTNLNSEFPTP